MKTICLLAVLMLINIANIHSQMSPDPVDASIFANVKTVKKGTKFWVAIEFKLEKDWHTYWINPGAAGLPTTIKWTLPDGVTASPIHWQYPHWIEDSGIVSLAYDEEVAHLVEISVPENYDGKNVKLQADVAWLVCTNEGDLAGCYPGDASLELDISIGDDSLADNQELFAKAHQKMPHTDNSWQILAQQEDKSVKFYLIPPEDYQGEMKEVTFFPEPEIFDLNSPQNLKYEEGIYILETKLAKDLPKKKLKLEEVNGILYCKTGWNQNNHPAWQISVGVSSEKVSLQNIKDLFSQNPNSSEAEIPFDLWFAVLFAFVGGIILNAMPCVLPVLSIKILGFVQEAGGDKSKIWKHGFAFTFGVLISFWVLVGCLFLLRETSLLGVRDTTLGWGYQLQSPIFILVLIVCFVLFSLNLFGLFEIGASLTAIGSSNKKKSGLSGSFSTGILATIVATPCSAPFMGTAIGYAMLQPIHLAFLVFSSLALGLAFPYLFISIFPSFLKLVPKPGRWMDSFKKLLAFPLLATAAWLFSVFIQLVATDTSEAGEVTMYSLFGLIAISAAAWIYGRWISFQSNSARKILAIITALGLFVSGFYACYSYIDMEKSGSAKNENSSKTTWIDFSPEKVKEILAAEKPLFIDFTAAWCLTCQVNKKVALRTQNVTEKFAEHGITTMSADWTRRDPEIGIFLQKFDRSSVPLYVLYSGKNDEYVILPQILTPDIVIQEIEKIGK